MAGRYHNPYRSASARAAWWHYGWAGAYFITICTQGRQHYLGEVVHGQMVLSNAGVLADVFWHDIPQHARHVSLGAFVVMPNHVHGILILNESTELVPRPDSPVVGTGHALSLQWAEQPDQQPHDRPNEQLNPPPQPPGPTIAQQRFQNPGKNTVSSIIGGYKSAVTKHANRLGLPFGWQTRFHDHIIRNDAEYQRINDYIENNPQQWENDTFFKTATP